MDHQNLFAETEDYVVNLFMAYNGERLAYHNLDHTRYVVKRATQIAAHYELSELETYVVILSAWFHDVGYLTGKGFEHEERSIEMLKVFAAQHRISDDIVAKASACIQATKMCNSPKNLLEEILVDADTYNLGTKKFRKTNIKVYEELRNSGYDASDSEFEYKTITLLENHKYYTRYAQDLLTASKLENMKKIKEKKSKGSDVMELTDGKGETHELVIDEKQGTTKGMQTMLRLTSANHIRLSEMADSKANILISVNAIIISVILSVLLRKLGEDPYLTIPTLIFLTVSVVTIVLAIMATRPKVNAGVFSQEDVDNKKTNLLFFGNFHRMEFNAYSNAMKTMMTDADYLYSSMVQDIYALGIVLGRKYKLLRAAYTLFMIGIIVSVLAFAIASVASGSAPVEMGNSGGKGSGSPF